MSFVEPGWALVLHAVAFLATLVGTRAFVSFAMSRDIVANPNFRSLHGKPMPRGGGAVFSAVFLVIVASLWLLLGFDDPLMRALVPGGAAALVAGFMDDIVQIEPIIKFSIQGVLAAWVLFCFGGEPLLSLPGSLRYVDLALSWIALVWLMNLYNFMDGVDGMAASGAVFICAAAIVALVITGGDRLPLLVLGLLASCTLAFLVFNWPPARIFMGESGSLTLGYFFCALIAGTTLSGQISLWTWLIAFGYFAGDTTTTTVFRLVSIRTWYRPHRSHAYQNLARISGSHLKVVRGVLLYHVLWLLPLVVWSNLNPSMVPLAVALALGPVIAWTLRYGPRLSSS